MRFRDRRDAGNALADALLAREFDRPVVIGLARGGVVVAKQVADRLLAPLDLMVVRKIGAPGNPEFAIGALTDGVLHVDKELVSLLDVPESYLMTAIPAELEELKRREAVYRGGRPKIPIQDRTVILVDDGLATGASARVAIDAVRKRRPALVVLAVPIAAPDTALALGTIADQVIALVSPDQFTAVSVGYEDFTPTSDDEVLRCLEADPGSEPGAGPGASDSADELT